MIIGKQMQFGWACNEKSSNTRETHTRAGAFKVQIISTEQE